MSFAPLLQAAKYLPSSLVLKGLEKISPKFKNFFTEAAAYGYDTDRALSFLTEKFSNPGAQQTENELEQGAAQGNLRPDEMAAREQIKTSQIPGKVAKTAIAYGAPALAGLASRQDGQNQQPQQEASQAQPESSKQAPGGFQSLIAQFPELGSFLDDLILKKGLAPEQAASEARKKRLFKPIISKIEKDVGQSFEQLLTQLFQGREQQQSPQQGQGGQKEQFLQGLNQLGQMLQSLKGR